MKKLVLHAARWVLRLEPFLLGLMVFAFWFPDPPNRVRSLLVLPPLIAARLILHRRLWTRTPLDAPLAVFLVLCVLNVLYPPVPGWGWVVLGRPVMGIALAYSAVDAARRHEKMNVLLWITVGFSLLLGVVALTTSQWTEKSAQLLFLINPLPSLRSLPVITGGFNVNEIAGAMSWLTPLAAALAVGGWRGIFPRLRYPATIAFLLLLLALFLGQSRFALFGVIPVLALLIFTLIPPNRWRWGALAALALFTLLEIIIFTGILLPAGDVITPRDEDSLQTRFLVWEAAVNMMRDHPLTGLGMNMFRTDTGRILYPVPGYEGRVLPHAHNELLQVGADLGFPGVIIFMIWHGVLAIMLWECWRRGDAAARVVAVGCGGGLLAHAFFGLGDAITLWDRFTFVYWWMVGLAAAQYFLVRRAQRQTAAVAALQPALET